ncbi:hypothetical protein ACIQZN_33305 [Streptomyces sp. NPDC097595]|uniref:hypothetical protein n=1 Tax=Streptomyces sp. NPDC097595 TaxID=3366090 RepID=UPI0037FA72D4
MNSRRVVYRLDGSGLHPTALLDSWVTPGGQRVVQRFGDTDTYRVWDLTDLSKPAHEITLTDAGGEKLLGVVGDEVLYTRPSATGGDTATDHTVLAVPVTGGPERVVLDRAAAIPVVEPDGTMLLGRASGSQDAASSVYALRAGAEGRVTTAKVADVAAIATVVEGMSMAQGRLHTVDRIPFGQARLRRNRRLDERRSDGRSARGPGAVQPVRGL